MRDSKAIRLFPLAEPQSQDLGRLLTAPEVAELVCHGKVSAKWVIQRMGPRIGKKPGRQWLFWQVEAEREWHRHLNQRISA